MEHLDTDMTADQTQDRKPEPRSGKGEPTHPHTPPRFSLRHRDDCSASPRRAVARANAVLAPETDESQKRARCRRRSSARPPNSPPESRAADAASGQAGSSKARPTPRAPTESRSCDGPGSRNRRALRLGGCSDLEAWKVSFGDGRHRDPAARGAVGSCPAGS